MSDTPRSDDEQRGDFVHIRFARQLERENAALKAALDHQMTYQRELRADKARLDWMQEMKLTILHHDGKVFGRGVNPPCTRTAIDAAMGEGK